MKKLELSSRSIPKLYCDLNACGWSGEPDDNCYYALHREQLAALKLVASMRVFIWDWSDSELIVGREASLERFDDICLRATLGLNHLISGTNDINGHQYGHQTS
jgi:hypothetical protein